MDERGESWYFNFLGIKTTSIGINYAFKLCVIAITFGLVKIKSTKMVD